MAPTGKRSRMWIISRIMVIRCRTLTIGTGLKIHRANQRERYGQENEYEPRKKWENAGLQTVRSRLA
jgi:hypothetical protein